MISTVEIRRNPETGHIRQGYPWERLQEIGDILVLEGKDLNPPTARSCAYQFTKKRGWKIRMQTILNPPQLHITRIG